MVNFKFAKFHCYQQIQSFLITPYYRGQNILVVIVTLMIFNCKASFRMVNLIFYCCQNHFNLSVTFY
jgi:hypothetical protein